MGVHVLLNLLNDFMKRDVMRGLSRMLSLFRNEFNESNKTCKSTYVIDSFFHMTYNTLKSHFWCKNAIFFHNARKVVKLLK